jgi:hypothetical protein
MCGRCQSDYICFDDSQCISKVITIRILDAVIGPGKADGTQWDGMGTVPQDVIDMVAGFISTGSLEGIVSYLTGVAVSTLSKPDPLGTAIIDNGNGFDIAGLVVLANEGNNTEDTFTPIWPNGGKKWGPVPFVPSVKFQFIIYDEDLVNNDDIGVALVDFDDLMAAWADGNKYWVNVADQTSRQLIAIGLTVSASGEQVFTSHRHFA